VIAAVYPVGSLYLSTNSTNPATSLGFGTWVAFGAGRVPVGFDAAQTEFDADEETGGTKTVASAGTCSAPTFTGSALAAHTHTFTGSASQATSLVSAGTPAGTCSAPTFTGSALAAHAHELPIQIPSTTTTRQLAAATFGTGTSRAATAVSATGTANTTSAAVALSQAVSAGTPAGTVSAPTFTGSALATHQHTLTPAGGNSSDSAGTPAGTVSAPTFTGASTSVVQPYIVVRMWKRVS
jgi:hypothetical protein